MIKEKYICIHSNGTSVSKETCEVLSRKLMSEGYIISHELNSDTELLVCIGGDGAILDALHKFDFPKVPVIGINTGHLGFFQEVESHQLDDFIFNYKNQKYRLQPLSTVEAVVTTNDGKQKVLRALNEITIRGKNYMTAHLSISIDGSFIERFSGDGLLIATSAGSTAYNYSIGGSIVDPRLNLLQVTPIAPMNTTAYRSFTSSILLPSDLSLEVLPDDIRNRSCCIVSDGITYDIDDISHIKVRVSSRLVNLLRFETYDFWNKVKTKFL